MGNGPVNRAQAGLPDRQSIRKRGWDYTAPGWYFVTVNTRRNAPLFGIIVNGRMILNDAGRVAEACWRAIPDHFSTTENETFTIMPNHMHGLVRLNRPSSETRAPTLGDVVGAYKSAVSRTIRRRGGQLPTPAAAGASALRHRNYWDVIVHDETALANIRRYIRDNPRNWHAVENAGEPRFLGNRALLDGPTVGFLASRGPAHVEERFTMRPGEAVFSGFLSPMERAVFRAGLADGTPLIWVKPSGLREGTETPAVRRALDDGRLLVVSPFDDAIEAPNQRRAAWCNLYVLARAGRMVIGHLNPGGLLACLLSETDPDKEIAHPVQRDCAL